MNMKYENLIGEIINTYQTTSFGYKRIARMFNLPTPQTARDILKANGVKVRWQVPKKVELSQPKYYEGLKWSAAIDFTNRTTRAKRFKKARLFENDEFRLGFIKLKSGELYYKWYPKRTKNPTREQITDLIRLAKSKVPRGVIIADGEFTQIDKSVKRVKPYSKLWSIKENCFGGLKSISYYKHIPFQQVLEERALEIE